MIPSGILMNFPPILDIGFRTQFANYIVKNKIILILKVSLYVYSSLRITVLYLAIFQLTYTKDDFLISSIYC